MTNEISRRHRISSYPNRPAVPGRTEFTIRFDRGRHLGIVGRRGLNHLCRRFDADPPEACPVRLIVIEQQGDFGIVAEVAHADELSISLGLAVYRRPEAAARSREDDRNLVKSAVASLACKPHDRPVLEPFRDGVLRELHDRTLAGTGE